jgi:hypothetical protein
MAGLLDMLGLGGGQPTLDQLDPRQFGNEVGLLDPITLARMNLGIKTGASRASLRRERDPLSLPPEVAPDSSLLPSAGPMDRTAIPTPPNDPAGGVFGTPQGPTGRPGVRWNQDAPGTMVDLRPQGGSLAIPPGPQSGPVADRAGYGPGRGIGSDVVASPPPPTPASGLLTPGPGVGIEPGRAPVTATSPLPSPREIDNPSRFVEPQMARAAPNALSSIGDFLHKHSNLFLGLSAGFGGARSLSEGFGRAASGVASGAQADRVNNAINLTKQALLAKGFTEEEADAAANNPTLMKAALERFTPKWQYKTVKEPGGGESPVLFNEHSGATIPAGSTIVSSFSEALALPKNTVFYDQQGRRWIR